MEAIMDCEYNVVEVNAGIAHNPDYLVAIAMEASSLFAGKRLVHGHRQRPGREMAVWPIAPEQAAAFDKLETLIQILVAHLLNAFSSFQRWHLRSPFEKRVVMTATGGEAP
jgi:hypothetical protein